MNENENEKRTDVIFILKPPDSLRDKSVMEIQYVLWQSADQIMFEMATAIHKWFSPAPLDAGQVARVAEALRER